jgi:hypothetical protein
MSACRLLSDVGAKVLNSSEDAHTKSMSTFETVEHLRTNAAQQGRDLVDGKHALQLRNLVT